MKILLINGSPKGDRSNTLKLSKAFLEGVLEIDKDAEIIIVSSVGTQSQLRSAIEAGAKDFIQKPLNPEQLHSIITSRFEGR